MDIGEKFVETLPWIDFAPLIAELEKRKKKKGRKEGRELEKAERDLD